MFKIKSKADAVKFVNLLKNDRFQLKVHIGDCLYYMTRDDSMSAYQYTSELEEYDIKTRSLSSRKNISFDESVEWVYFNREHVNKEMDYHEDLRSKIKEGVYDFRTVLETRNMVMLLHYIDIENINLAFRTGSESWMNISHYKQSTFRTTSREGTYIGIRFYKAIGILNSYKESVLSALRDMFADYEETKGTKYDTVVLQRLLRETEPVSFLKYIHENGLAVRYNRGVRTRLIIPLKGTDYQFKSIIHSDGILVKEPAIRDLEGVTASLVVEGIPTLTRGNFFEADEIIKEEIVQYSKPLEIKKGVNTPTEPKKVNSKVHSSLIINSITGEMLGVAGIQTGLKLRGYLLHTGDVVKYLNDKKQLVTSMVVLHKDMITLSDVLDKPLSSIRLYEYVSRYYTSKGSVDLNGLKIVFKRITV